MLVKKTDIVVLTLTPQALNDDMREAGVRELPAGRLPWLRDMLYFDDIPTAEELRLRAAAIATEASRWFDGNYVAPPRYAIVGEPAVLLQALCDELEKRNIKPVFAVWGRVLKEVETPSGPARRWVKVLRGFVDARTLTEVGSGTCICENHRNFAEV